LQAGRRAGNLEIGGKNPGPIPGFFVNGAHLAELNNLIDNE